MNIILHNGKNDYNHVDMDKRNIMVYIEHNNEKKTKMTRDKYPEWGSIEDII